ncbi:hypothetical protein G7Y79_00003g012070 [Physcia stellaris]|nr:hypothetical protein G7Y79_00003g012070 [Physcia stellaris]
MSSPSIPIILLKSPSNPPESDSYTQLFRSPLSGPASTDQPTYTYNPVHIPRAVSAFALALSQLPESDRKPEWHIPIYAVGPATTKAIKATCAQHLPGCEASVLGEEAGTGEALVHIILKDYNSRWKEQENELDKGEDEKKKPLLFLTGAKHRDVIPRLLSSPSLPATERIDVRETVIYTTTSLPNFLSSFRATLDATEQAMRYSGARWIVVFSATGGEDMLRALGWLNEKTGQAGGAWKEEGRKTFVASIGPTTRDWLRESFGFEVDVCARKPSAEGVREGVEAFMKGRDIGCRRVEGVGEGGDG